MDGLNEQWWRQKINTRSFVDIEKKQLKAHQIMYREKTNNLEGIKYNIIWQNIKRVEYQVITVKNKILHPFVYCNTMAFSSPFLLISKNNR